MPTREEKLKSFIEKNHDVVEFYHQKNHTRLLSVSENKIHTIKLLFMSAMVAAGGSVPVKHKYTSFNNFDAAMAPIKDFDVITFNDFAKCFLSNFERPSQLPELINYFTRSKYYPNFADKKSKLFIKELILLGGDNVFSDFSESDYVEYLAVPIDVVHRKVYCVFNRIAINNYKKYDPEINRLASSLFKDHSITYDDIWFWGHFSFNGNIFLNESNIQLIKTDINCSENFINDNDLISKCNEFIKIISNNN